MMTSNTIKITISASDLSKKANETHALFAVASLIPNNREMDTIILGQTEMIKGSADLNWKKSFFVNREESSEPQSECEKLDYVLIKIYAEVLGQDSYREMESSVFELGAILAATDNTITKICKGNGKVDVRAERVSAQGNICLQMSGIALQNPRRFKKKTHPFFEIARRDISQRGVEYTVVHKSATFHKNSLNPKWQNELIDMDELCSGNFDHPLSVSVYHYKSNGNHVLMGNIETSVNGLVSARNRNNASVLKIKKEGVVTGTLDVLVAKISEDDTIQDTGSTASSEDVCIRSEDLDDPIVKLGESVRTTPLEEEFTERSQSIVHLKKYSQSKSFCGHPIHIETVLPERRISMSKSASVLPLSNIYVVSN
jgi:hypothetical protein